MRRPRTFYHGAPRTAGAHTHQLKNEYSAFSLVGVREGLVVRVLYCDDPANRCKSAVEYVVKDLNTQQEYQCQKGEEAGGVDDGDETILRAAEKTTTSAPLTAYTAAKSTDGDHVLFQPIEGSSLRGVIVKVLPHREARWRARRADGRRRLIRNAGTNLQLAADGAFTVTRDKDKTRVVVDNNGNTEIHADGDFCLTREKDDTALTLLDDGTVTLHHKSGASLKIDALGAVSVDAAPLQLVRLQGGGPGVARLGDTVSASGLDGYMQAVTAALGVLAGDITQLQALVPTLVMPVVPTSIPSSAGVISSASKLTQSG